MDRGLNELLKWSIENADGSRGDLPQTDPAAAPPTNRGLNPEALAALFGGPSDAELMQAAMAVITAPPGDANNTTLDDRLVAFDNFEQLVESLDNANNMAQLGLWTPLLAVLESDEAELRRMAAWCVGTAVQNNPPSQERLLAVGGIPPLVQLATNADEPAGVRRKAVYALSSACRNYQPAMDACLAALRALDNGWPERSKAGTPSSVDAQNMDAVDAVFDEIKTEVQAAQAAEAAAAEEKKTETTSS